MDDGKKMREENRDKKKEENGKKTRIGGRENRAQEEV